DREPEVPIIILIREVAVGRQEDQLGLEIQVPSGLRALPERVFVALKLVAVLSRLDLILDDHDERPIGIVEFQPQVAARPATWELMRLLGGDTEAMKCLRALRGVTREAPERVLAWDEPSHHAEKLPEHADPQVVGLRRVEQEAEHPRVRRFMHRLT